MNQYSDEEDYDYSHFEGIFNEPEEVIMEETELDNANVAKFTCLVPKLEAAGGRVRLFVDLKVVSTATADTDEMDVATYAAVVPKEGLEVQSGGGGGGGFRWSGRASGVALAPPGAQKQCGSQLCHKYANCMAVMDLSAREFACRCLPGFQGDGQDCQRSQSKAE